MNKRLWKVLAVSLLIGSSLPSCELDDCKMCRQVCSDGYESPEAEYCGAALIAIDGKSSTIGGKTCSWVCN